MKKGFTLIELLVSIVLLSIVMVFMINLVISLKEKKDNLNIDVDLMVNQTVISKTINYDVATYGISSVSCDNSLKCTITFKNSTIRTIEITASGTSIKYYNGTNIYLVRTIESDTFSSIIYTSQELENSTFQKIVIETTNNPDYNIEIYDY